MPGFEFVGGRVVPLGQGQQAYDEIMSGVSSRGDDALAPNMGRGRSAPAQASLFPEPARQAAPPTPASPAREPSRLQKPRDIVKAAKARIREIKREIARAEKLRKELDELTRLVAAAEAPKLAVVPSARTAR